MNWALPATPKPQVNSGKYLRTGRRMWAVDALRRLLFSFPGGGVVQFDHGFAEGLANRAERPGAAQVVIGSIGSDFVPFVFMLLPSLLVQRVGLVVPEGVRCHHLHIALELRKLADGRLGGSEIRFIRARITDSVHTHLTNHERKLG